MQTKIRVVIAHKEYAGSFINRRSDGLTTDADKAMHFNDMGEASEFLLNNMYAPEDKERYTYKKIKITTEVLEDEEDDREYESLRESQISP
jgi:hypothetical protein